MRSVTGTCQTIRKLSLQHKTFLLVRVLCNKSRLTLACEPYWARQESVPLNFQYHPHKKLFAFPLQRGIC